MDTDIRIGDLSNRDVSQLSTQFASQRIVFQREDEAQTEDESHELGLSAVIIAATPPAIAAVAAWLASKDRAVSLEISVLGVMRLKLTVEPRTKSPKRIEAEVASAVAAARKK